MEQAKNHEIELPDVPLFFLDILFKANVYSTPSASPTSTFGPVTPQGLHNRATWEITHSDKESHMGVDERSAVLALGHAARDTDLMRGCIGSPQIDTKSTYNKKFKQENTIPASR